MLSSPPLSLLYLTLSLSVCVQTTHLLLNLLTHTHSFPSPPFYPPPPPPPPPPPTHTSVYWQFSACVCYMVGAVCLLVPFLMLLFVAPKLLDKKQ